MDVSGSHGSVMCRGPGLLVHGGAWDIPDVVLEAHREGLREALACGQRLIEVGRPAVDVAVETVACLEAHAAFNAGHGAMLNRDGRVQLDAGVMDGSAARYGSVMGVEHVRHPVRVARRLMEAGCGEVCMLMGRDAEAFAVSEGFARVDNDVLVCDRERDRFERLRRELKERPRTDSSRSFLPSPVRPGARMGPGARMEGADTVGCVARDARGRLAAATSTGGTPLKPPGRVGDSPIPGSGFYATEHAAVSSTGWGEAIAGVVLAHGVAGEVERGEDPEQAATARLADMQRRIANRDGDGARGGVIVLTPSSAAWAYTTPRMARGAWSAGAGAWVDV